MELVSFSWNQGDLLILCKLGEMERITSAYLLYIYISVAKLHREVGACIHNVVYIVVPILSIVWFSLPVGSGMDINLIVTMASF